MRKFVIGAAVVLSAWAALALSHSLFAQTIAVPQAATVTATKDLLRIVPNGQPNVAGVFTTPAGILSTSNYTVASPLSGGSATFGNTQTEMIFNGAATTAAYTVTTAPAPSDGDKECIYTKGAITSLTLSANTGETINDAVTSMNATTRVCYIYTLNSLTWNRAQ